MSSINTSLTVTHLGGAVTYPTVSATNGNTILGLIYKFSTILNYTIGLLIGAAVVFIVYNIFEFIRQADSEDARDKYRSAIIWGIVGLAVIVSIWGLVAILTNTFGTDNSRYAGQTSNDYNSLMVNPGN